MRVTNNMMLRNTTSNINNNKYKYILPKQHGTR